LVTSVGIGSIIESFWERSSAPSRWGAFGQTIERSEPKEMKR